VSDEIFRMTFKTTLKPYVNAQYRSSTVLGDHAINCSSVEEFNKLFYDLVVEHAVGLAVPSECDGVRRYALEESIINEGSLNTYIIFKHNNHFYTINDPPERQHGATRM
jgi:hypothetical protein